MSVYVKINNNRYPAVITGKLNDKDWNNRSSKSITLEMTYSDAVEIFIDDVKWMIEQDYEVLVEQYDENGETVYIAETQVESYDNSEYSIAGPITDNRDGTVTVKMGKLTAEELLAIIQEAL